MEWVSRSAFTPQAGEASITMGHEANGKWTAIVDFRNALLNEKNALIASGTLTTNRPISIEVLALTGVAMMALTNLTTHIEGKWPLAVLAIPNGATTTTAG